MNDISIGATHTYSFGTLLGSNNAFLTINIETITHTWIMMSLFFVGIALIKYMMKKSALINQMVLLFTRTLANMITQSFGEFSYEYFTFITSIFVFIALCNLAPLIPGLEEPTKDLNTTLALGIISFCYVQLAAIKSSGLWNYIKGEFLSPLFLFPLHVIGKIASIMSISLRLFGNIFGGSIITKIYTTAAFSSFALFGFTSFLPVNILLTCIFIAIALIMNLIITIFFTVAEGFLQAFVFTTLTLTYLSIAVRNEGGH